MCLGATMVLGDAGAQGMQQGKEPSPQNGAPGCLSPAPCGSGSQEPFPHRGPTGAFPAGK